MNSITLELCLREREEVLARMKRLTAAVLCISHWPQPVMLFGDSDVEPANYACFELF